MEKAQDAVKIVKDDTLTAPKSIQESIKKESAQDTKDIKKSVPKLIQTRARVFIKPKSQERVYEGTKTTTDETFTGKFVQPKFFEEIEDVKKIDRNKSHIQHKFTIADGYHKDVWDTTYNRAHGFIPEEYPAGYMTNQGISAMYTTFTRNGQLGGCDYKRQYQGFK